MQLSHIPSSATASAVQILIPLLSLGLKVSPSQCLHSQCSRAPKVPPWSTCSCMHCMWAWCPAGSAGDEPDTAGAPPAPPSVPQTQSTASPQLPGGKGGWYPMTIPNQHPPVSSQLSPNGARGAEQIIPWPCDGVWWKNHPLLSLGLGKALGPPRVPRASLAQGLQPRSHVGREDEVVPTLTHRVDTLQKTGIASVGRGFLRLQRSQGRVEQSGTVLVWEQSCLKAASVPGTAAEGSP